MRFALLPFALVMLTASAAQDTLRVQLHGSVVDAGTGAPVLEALVEWFDAAGKRQAITQTNSEGHYAFFLLTTGFVELRVEENGYQSYRERLPDIGPGEGAREFTVRLVPK